MAAGQFPMTSCGLSANEISSRVPAASCPLFLLRLSFTEELPYQHLVNYARGRVRVYSSGIYIPPHRIRVWVSTQKPQFTRLACVNKNSIRICYRAK